VIWSPAKADELSMAVILDVVLDVDLDIDGDGDVNWDDHPLTRPSV
jgi:hypothetical protein